MQCTLEQLKIVEVGLWRWSSSRIGVCRGDPMDVSKHLTKGLCSPFMRYHNSKLVESEGMSLDSDTYKRCRSTMIRNELEVPNVVFQELKAL